MNGASSKQEQVRNCVKGVNPVGLHSDPEEEIEPKSAVIDSPNRASRGPNSLRP